MLIIIIRIRGIPLIYLSCDMIRDKCCFYTAEIIVSEIHSSQVKQIVLE